MTPQLKAALREKIAPIVKEPSGQASVSPDGETVYLDQYPKTNRILNALQPEIERLVVEGRIEELSHVVDGCMVADDEPYTTINGDYVSFSDRIAQLTQLNQLDKKKHE